MTVTTKQQNTDAHVAQLGREWAHMHIRFPGGAIEPGRYGNLVHDKACADEWFRIQGKRLSWDDAPPRHGERGYDPYPNNKGHS